MLRAALTRLAGWRPDVVHAHDWLVAHPAIALADVLGVPLVGDGARHRGRPMHRLAVLAG